VAKDLLTCLRLIWNKNCTVGKLWKVSIAEGDGGGGKEELKTSFLLFSLKGDRVDVAVCQALDCSEVSR
jgi:hypothetical protein